jgi:hypothetical protein
MGFFCPAHHDTGSLTQAKKSPASLPGIGAVRANLFIQFRQT